MQASVNVKSGFDEISIEERSPSFDRRERMTSIRSNVREDS